ncbi:hypothetical protein ABIF50_006225 [Bradyrhizobium diazoefficiens]|uniref:Phage tail protein n=1 Tax=Bradyrhizobium diazoefficiens TaxID=1355477 RepID=A0A809XU50_9BRAD|nr:hypothetical protein [Bradyrhizobium diazoefficiens]BCA04088.1 hypothetical protein H12S4_49920 [Bradyrhizobium diazoefficiens]BCA21447.1 hypothetical protein BDHH15_46620 [Bradyrhizobium diazoefficiens]BCE31552.1 hypothetical protein XF2B_53210 [Bradyrhizobium diazoefficiens]BCE39615.1 hypothetical protein XF3B_46460 [Bradyrhizobium diazoefficiens]BCF18626.1 hypothetical protein XF13B_53170 [Bradyrhizobium diazoefficiens]
MADPWPDTLPQCFVVGYSEGLPDGVAEVTPDIGPPISRGRSSAMARPLSGQMRMTRAQIATLKAFVEVTLDRGALPFEFPDPTEVGETLLVKFAKGDKPSWQQVAAGVYRVGITLTVLP